MTQETIKRKEKKKREGVKNTKVDCRNSYSKQRNNTFFYRKNYRFLKAYDLILGESPPNYANCRISSLNIKNEEPFNRIKLKI